MRTAVLKLHRTGSPVLTAFFLLVSSLSAVFFVHCVPKSVTTLSRYKSDIHELILIIFGTNVTEKVGNQKLLYFLTLCN